MKTFCVGIDAITARFYHVRAENEEQAREKLRTFIDGIPDASHILDVEYHAENDEEYDLPSIRTIEECASLPEEDA